MLKVIIRKRIQLSNAIIKVWIETLAQTLKVMYIYIQNFLENQIKLRNPKTHQECWSNYLNEYGQTILKKKNN